MIALLIALRGHLRGLDLSGLFIRGASLQGVELQDATLSGALLLECVFTENFDAIPTVAISKSGQYWAAANWNGEVRVWAEGGQRLHQAWQAHSSGGTALAFSPDGRILASGGWDSTVKLWDVESGLLLMGACSPVVGMIPSFRCGTRGVAHWCSGLRVRVAPCTR